MRLLNNHFDATQARINLMSRAQKTIKAQYFIYGNDVTALAGLAFIRDAVVERNVKAQIIVDAYFNDIPPSVMSYLGSIGVEIKNFHPFRVMRPSWIIRRMHDKGISIDGVEMIRGGRNIVGSYFGFSKARNYIDRDIYVRGSEVGSSDAYFDELFSSGEVAPVELSIDPVVIAEGKRLLDEAFAQATANGSLASNEFSLAENNHIVNDLHFIHDPVGLKGKRTGIAQKIAGLLLSAKHKVLIESPYLVPTTEFLNHIRTLKAKNPNIEITILTNSAVSTDGLLPQGGYIRYRRQLIAMGIRIFEYKGPEALHAKSIVIDDELAGVSSYNLDPRSQFYNTEVGIVIRDQAISAELTSSIEERMANAWEIGADGQPLSGEDALAGMSRLKKVALRASICTSYLIKNQL